MWPTQCRTLSPLILLRTPRQGKTVPLPNIQRERSSRIYQKSNTASRRAKMWTPSCPALGPTPLLPKCQKADVCLNYFSSRIKFTCPPQTFTVKGRRSKEISEDPVNSSTARGLMWFFSQDALVSQNSLGGERLCLDLPISKNWICVKPTTRCSPNPSHVPERHIHN